MADKKPVKNTKRRQAIIRIVIMAMILVCINILASYFHGGIDLTHEKRFTLTTPTRKLLQNMTEVAVVDVYLKGKFPADMQRMVEGVREQLAAFKGIAGNRLIYRFSDPLEGKNEQDVKQVVRDMKAKGIDYMQLPTREEDGFSMKICFPFALLHYNGKELPINLLENPPGKNREEQISYAKALLEYKLANGINQLASPTKKRIAYAIGHGEDLSVKSFDMLSTLSILYNLDSLNLARLGHISNAYDAIIINKPTIPFTDPEKLKIDQYVMRGGHILWVVNTLNASMDSFNNGSLKAFALENGLNLDDILFKYGVRINPALVEDFTNMKVPLMGPNHKMELHDWPYFPKINPTSEHPISRNMNFIRAGFTNTMDTILTAGITKTILLQTSKYSRISTTPVTVSLSKAFYPGVKENFTKTSQNVAVLMEGQFHSLFENRLAMSYQRHLDSIKEHFIPVAKNSTSMIVTCIDDIFANDYSTKDGVMTLGYCKYDGEFYANKDFLLNCLEYLTDKSGLMEARSKDVKLRLLDKGRVKDERVIWQWVNVSIPIALVLIFASGYIFFRKRRYEVNTNTPKTTVKDA